MLAQATVLLLVPLHAATVWARSESTPPPFPPPGKLIDVGGWRLHLNCTGEVRASQPTVILERSAQTVVRNRRYRILLASISFTPGFSQVNCAKLRVKTVSNGFLILVTF